MSHGCENVFINTSFAILYSSVDKKDLYKDHNFVQSNTNLTSNFFSCSTLYCQIVHEGVECVKAASLFADKPPESSTTPICSLVYYPMQIYDRRSDAIR